MTTFATKVRKALNSKSQKGKDGWSEARGSIFGYTTKSYAEIEAEMKKLGHYRCPTKSTGPDYHVFVRDNDDDHWINVNLCGSKKHYLIVMDDQLNLIDFCESEGF